MTKECRRGHANIVYRRADGKCRECAKIRYRTTKWQIYYKNYHKRRYQTDEEYRLRRKFIDKKHYDEGDRIIREAKSKPCSDCGIQYNPWVMDFDHLYDKKFTIGNCRSKPKRLLAEISKCEVVCSNCHRERTYKRKVTLHE